MKLYFFLLVGIFSNPLFDLTFGMLKMIERANIWEEFGGPDEMIPELQEMEREFMKQANIDGKKKKISLSSKETVKKQLF